MKTFCVDCGEIAETLSCDRCLGNFCANCRINHSLFRLHCMNCYELLALGISWVDTLIAQREIEEGGLQT